MDDNRAELERQESLKFRRYTLEKAGEREAAHKKAFTKWINSKLLQRDPPSRINNIGTDLSDGKALLDLLEVLTDMKLQKEKGSLRVHKINNVERALGVLEKCNVKLVGINGFDIVDGKIRVILGLLWSIILRFQVQEVMQQEGGEESAKSFVVEKSLLEWCKERLNGYDIKISDFSGSWRDGRAFNALLHSYRPNAFDFSKLDAMDERERLDHAFSFGEKQFKIIKILDSSDVYVERPDKKLIILCLSHWYDYLEGSKAKERQEMLKQEEVIVSVDDNVVESNVPGSWDDIDASSQRSVEDCAAVKSENNRKLGDLEASVSDVESRKPIVKETDLIDIESCKKQLERQDKYLRSIDSLEQTKNEVFKDVNQSMEDGYCDQQDCEHYNRRMTAIENNINGLREEADRNKQRVKSSYNVKLHRNLQKIEDILTKSENHIKKAQEVSGDYESLKKQQEDHQKFREELSDSTFINMYLEVDINDPSIDDKTREKIKSINQRWKNVSDWSEERRKLLMRALGHWQKFRDEELILLNWLAGKEKALKAINKTDLMDDTEVRKSEAVLEQIQQELDDQEARLDVLHQCGEKLIVESKHEAETKEEIEKQLSDFDGCWNDIATQVLDGKEKLRNGSNKMKEMTSEMEEVNKWMDDANKLMADHDKVENPQERNKVKDKIELKCEERPKTHNRVQRADLLGKDLMSIMAKESREKLEKDLDQFNQKWTETNAALESFSDKGYTEKSECCLMRIIKRKFKSTNN